MEYWFEIGPLLLAFVLGRILERSLRQALLISHGDVSIFFALPISAAFLAVVALIILASIGMVLYKRRKVNQLP